MLPVTGASWRAAVTFAQTRRKRLPTEAEWEVAAGWNPWKAEMQLFPWGDEADPNQPRCAITGTLEPVTRYDKIGRSPLKCADIVRTVRSECCDRLLILNQEHLERVLQGFIDHYNGHRLHRAPSLTPPAAKPPTVTPSASADARIVRRDRLGGVVHEYVRAA